MNMDRTPWVLLLLRLFCQHALSRGAVLGGTLLLTLTLISPLSAQVSSTDAKTQSEETEPKVQRVDSVFAAFDNTRSPGCAVGVQQGGKTVLARGYGMANLEHGVPISPSTVFRVGSVSKQFTAAAVLLLEQDGALSLDDHVGEWVPRLPEHDPPITLRQLLHHTSGVRDYLLLMTLSGKRNQDYFTDEEVLQMISRQQDLNFQPGTEFLYSNSGYFLLGKVVEEASGQSLRAFARDRIFEPLGMEHSHFHDRPNHLVPGRATGYEPTDNGEYLIGVTNLPMVGDGGVFTSVRDFFRWNANLSRPAIGSDDFGQRMRRRGVLSTGDTLDYASGLIVEKHRGLRRVFHGGAFVGYRAGMMRFPEERFSLVALCNRSDAELEEKLNQVAEIYLGSKMEPPETEKEPEKDAGSTEQELGPEELRAYVGRYYSPDLGTEYRLKLKGQELKLVVGNHLDGTLTPTGEHEFERSFLTLQFRDPEDGQAQGFQLDAGRARGIEFEWVTADSSAGRCGTQRD